MSTGWKLARSVVVAVVMGCFVLPALAEMTAPEKLSKASELFKAGQYDQSKALLLEIDAAQLNAEQKHQRDELSEEVVVAINQSNKARRDLQDAEKALESGDRTRAGDLFRAVQKNAYASADQVGRAKNGLATIARQRELESKLPAKKPAKVATRPAAATTQPSRANQRGAAVSVAAQPAQSMDRSQAAAAVRAGNEALAHGQLDLAERHFQEALRISPNNADAISGLELVRQYRKAEGQSQLLGKAEQRRQAVAQRTEVLFRQNERDIRQAIADKQFDVARERLELTRRMVDGARRDFSVEDYNALVRQMDSLARFIDSEQHAYQEVQAQQQRKTARELEQQRRERDEQERQERIGQLFEQVMQLRGERQYEKAAAILREILVIDPTYERAKFVLDDMEQAALIKKQRDNNLKARNNLVEALEEAESARTPEVTGKDNQVVAYPSEEEWRIIAERDPFGAGISGEDEQDRRVREKLREKAPPVDFAEGTGLEEVLNWISEHAKVSISPNWNALTVIGIDGTSDTMGIKLENADFEAVLNLALSNVSGAAGEVDYDVYKGILRISTREDLDQKPGPYSRVYDVSDLLIRIPSFRSSSEGMGGMGGMMGGMGMGGGMMGGMGMGGMGMGGMGGMPG